MKLLVFTAGFYDRDYELKLFRLKHSCKIRGIELFIYGKGEFFSFFDSKINKLGVLLYEKQQSEGYTHALYTDAADSYFVQDLDDLISKYNSYWGEGCVVVSGERGCHPFGERSEEFPQSPTPFRFMNPGNFIGPIDELLKIIGVLKTYKELKTDDQGHWMKAYLDKRIRVDIDYYCRMFQTMSDCDYVEDFAVMERMLFNKVTGQFPSIVHFNGPKGDTYNQRVMEEVFTKIYGANKTK